MHRVLLIASFLVLLTAACAGESEYSCKIARWQEVSVPPDSDKASRMVWFYAANYADYEWQVLSKNGQICTQLTSAKPSEQREHPEFTPRVGELGGASSFVRVDDGWLVGFNYGEFGASLYWFSPDGQRNYKISDHQIVDFFSLADGQYAIEGLAHLSMSEGSIIRIARSQPSGHWQATSIIKLPFAPYAVSVRRDGTMLITLSDSLVQIGSDRNITTILSDPPWAGLYPNSSALSPDEKKLYVGMRQYVGEFDIQTNKIRLLIPSAMFLNKIPIEDELRIRKQYGR